MPTIYLAETHHPIWASPNMIQFIGDTYRMAVMDAPRPLPRSPVANEQVAYRQTDVRTVTLHRASNVFPVTGPMWWGEEMGDFADFSDHEPELDLAVYGMDGLFTEASNLRRFMDTCRMVGSACGAAHRPLPTAVYEQSYQAWCAFRAGAAIPPPTHWTTFLRTGAFEAGQYPRAMAVDYARNLGISADRIAASLRDAFTQNYVNDSFRGLADRISQDFRQAEARALAAMAMPSYPTPGSAQNEGEDSRDLELCFEQLYPNASTSHIDVLNIAENVLELLTDAEVEADGRNVLRHLGTVLHELADAPGVLDLDGRSLGEVMIKRLIELAEDAVNPPQRGRRVDLGDEDF